LASMQAGQEISETEERLFGASQDFWFRGGGGENGDLEFCSDRSMTEGVCGCKSTMQKPWARPWGARVARLPILPQECSPPPRGRRPAPASRATWEGIGAPPSMTIAIGGCRGVVPMSWTHPDRARTALSPISSRSRPCPQDCLPLPQLPHHRMSVAGGSERD
jgi:hypothetical protein